MGTDAPSQGISQFILDAGGSVVRASVPAAFEYEGDSELSDDGYFNDVRNEYRELTQRKLPPVMRVRVTVEVEPLSDEETERAWEDHRARQGGP
jgi:hypothetical protein